MSPLFFDKGHIVAISLGEAILLLKGDSSGLDQALGDAETKTSGWAGKVGGLVSNLATGAIIGGVTLAAGAIVGLGAATFSLSGDVQAAQSQIQASLGTTEERAKELGDVAVDVFANNFGGSIEEVSGHIAEAEKAIGSLAGTTDADLQTVIEGAYALSDVFGLEIGGPGGSIDSARVLMEKFGLGAQQSMDLLTAGMQQIPADDLAESLTEYGPLFAEMGFSAEEMFSIFESGAAAGILGTDKIGDAFKEFGIIMNEGTDDAREALGAMGLDYDQMAASVASGETTWADQFDTILGGLQGIEDPLLRNQLQVALFGTMAEDLGPSFADGLSTASIKLEEVAGATESLNAKYNTWGSLLEGFKRQALVALQPLADKVLEIGNQVMPVLSEAFGSLIETATPIIEQLAEGFGQLVTDLADWFVPFFNDTLVPAFRTMSDWLINEGWPAFRDFITPILDQVIPGLQQLATWGLQLALFVWPLLQMAIGFVTDNLNIILPILGILTAVIIAVSSPIALLVGLVLLLGTAWANNWGGIQEKTQAVLDFIMPYIETAMTFIQTTVQAALAFIQQWWADHGASVMAVVNAAFAFVQQFISNIMTNIQTVISVVLNAISAFWRVWGDTILLWTQVAWENIKIQISTALEIIGFIIDAAAALIEGDWQAFGDALQNIWEAWWSAAQQILSNALSVIQSIISTTISAVQSAWSSFTSTLSNAWSAAWSAIVAYVSQVTAQITTAIQTNIITPVLSAWNEFLYGGSGVVTIWNSAWSQVESTLSSIMSTITSTVQSAMNAVSSAISGIIGPVQNSINSIMSAIQPIIDRINDLLNLINQIPSNPFGGGPILSNLTNTIGAGGVSNLSTVNNNQQFIQNNYGANVTGGQTGEYQAAQILLGV